MITGFSGQKPHVRCRPGLKSDDINDTRKGMKDIEELRRAFYGNSQPLKFSNGAIGLMALTTFKTCSAQG